MRIISAVLNPTYAAVWPSAWPRPLIVASTPPSIPATGLTLGTVLVT